MKLPLTGWYCEGQIYSSDSKQIGLRQGLGVNTVKSIKSRLIYIFSIFKTNPLIQLYDNLSIEGKPYLKLGKHTPDVYLYII